MGIRLQSIHLKNWKCYKDEKIVFPKTVGKQITIIFGKNGFGKTSMLEAIQWCLYGSDYSGIANKAELLSRFHRQAVKSEPSLELSIALTFEKDGQVYDVSRTAKRVMKGTVETLSVYEPQVIIDGVNKPDARARIQSLLPGDCREFFFFDGVEIKEYAKNLHADHTRAAIERILGIPELKNLREDSDKALQQLTGKLKDAAADDQRFVDLELQLVNVQEQLEIAESQLDNAKSQHEAATDIYESLMAELKQMDALQGKFDELQRLEDDYQSHDQLLNEVNEDIDSWLRRSPILLLKVPIRDVADELQRSSAVSWRRAGSGRFLQFLVESDECVCGRDMDPAAREHVAEELEKIESGAIEDAALVEADDLRLELKHIAEREDVNIANLLDRRDQLSDDVNEISQAIDQLKAEIGDVSRERSRDIAGKLQEATEEMGKKRDLVSSRTEAVRQLKNEEDKLRRDVEQYAGSRKETASLGRQVELARKLKIAAQELIDWRITERKATIEQQTTQIHQQVTNKPNEYLSVEVKDDYTLGIRSVTGDLISPDTLSAGEKEALAFSFITGLNLASETAAPLVMDTPFGHLDTTHQGNLVRSLPSLPSQVVVLATDRDFPSNLLKEIRGNVAELMEITRPDEKQDTSKVNAMEKVK